VYNLLVRVGYTFISELFFQLSAGCCHSSPKKIYHIEGNPKISIFEFHCEKVFVENCSPV
jgi:hypothetical protein